MKNILIVMLSLGITLINSNAQTPTIEWQKTFGGNNSEFVECVVQTTDGGYIMAGGSNSTTNDVTLNHGGLDFWVVKVDALGVLEWQKTLGGTANENAYSIIQTTDGGYIVAGTSQSADGDLTNNYGGADVWVVKLNSLGTIVWQQTYGGSSTDLARDIKETADGGFVVVGRSESSDNDLNINKGNWDYWIFKINATGVMQWSKSYGGSNLDVAYSVEQTLDGGYIVCGETWSSDGDIVGFNGNIDAWVLKLNSTGNIVWKNTLGGSDVDNAASITQLSDGSYVFAGTSTSADGDVVSNNGDYDYWVVKLSTTGTIIWQNSIGGSGYDLANSIYKTSDDGFVIAGESNSSDIDATQSYGINDLWVIKINNNGVLVWEKSLGGSANEEWGHVIQNNDGDYIAITNSSSNDNDLTVNYGWSDYWIVKLKSCVDNGSTSYSICDGDTYQFGTQLLSTGGQYVETFQNQSGCDSIVTLTLTVNTTSSSTDVQTACGSYQWIDGNTYTTSNNIAQFTLSNANGCDSIVTLDLTILPSSNTTINDTICDGDTYQLGTQSLNSVGQFIETFQNQAGCDSVVTLNLEIESLPTANITMVGNDLQANTGGFTYQWYFNGTANGGTNQSYTPTQAGDYTVDVISPRGCTNTSAPYTVEGVSVDEELIFKLKIYPNPSTGLYSLKSDENFNYEVYSILGKLIIKSVSMNKNQSINLLNQEAGIYVLKIYKGANYIQSIKLIKR